MAKVPADTEKAAEQARDGPPRRALIFDFGKDCRHSRGEERHFGKPMRFSRSSKRGSERSGS